MARAVAVHEFLRTARETSPEGRAWLNRLPDLIADARRRWALSVVGPPYGGGAVAWVAPTHSPDGDAVLKISWPHPEAATEAAALRWWDGVATVRLLDEDPADWAMLLERCEPGTPLRDSGLSSERGLAIGAQLLDALWSKGVPASPAQPFPSMQTVCEGWADLATSRLAAYGPALRARGSDPGILALGVELLRSLPGSATRSALVHGDANPGNLLAARREPYLVIDPKPMIGDPAYDPWQLVAQLGWPFRSADAAKVVPERIRWLGDRLDLPPERIAAWGLARDVEGGLWAASEGKADLGAKWIRSAAIVAPMLG